MRQFYLYHLSLGVTGGALGMSSVSTMLTAGLSLPLGLASIGGAGLLVAAVYDLATANPEEFSVGRARVALVVVAALLAVIGVGLQLAG